MINTTHSELTLARFPGAYSDYQEHVPVVAEVTLTIPGILIPFTVKGDRRTATLRVLVEGESGEWPSIAVYMEHEGGEVDYDDTDEGDQLAEIAHCVTDALSWISDPKDPTEFVLAANVCQLYRAVGLPTPPPVMEHTAILDGKEIAARFTFWTEDCGADADPVYHVLSVAALPSGTLLDREDHDEDEWIEMLNKATETFIATRPRS